MLRLLIGCVLASAINAQPPAIGQNGIVNSASLIPPTLPGGALARGARFRIQGVRLTGSEPTTVLLTKGTASQDARILSATPLAIEAVVPRDAPLGSAEIRIRRGSQTSAPFPVEVVASNPGLYSLNGSGWGPGRVRNLGRREDDNSTAHPASPSEAISIIATGTDRVPPEVFIGSKPAKVLRIDRTAEPGMEAIVVEIPRSAPEGCFVPLYARRRGSDAPISNVITVSIRHGPGACLMPKAFPVSLLDSRSVGMVVISRASGVSQNGLGRWTDDDAVAAFVTRDPSPPNAPFLLIPPVGTCTVFTGSSQSPFQMPLAISDGFLTDLAGKGVDVGPALSVRNGGQTRVIPVAPGVTGFYRAPLGTSESRRRPLFLSPGSIVVTSPGGRDGGPFQLTLPLASPFTWTNRDTMFEIDRHRPLTLTWSPTSPNGVKLILAMAVDQLTTARAMLYCVASDAPGRFTVPPEFLANFPATQDIPGEPLNQLAIAAPMLHAPVAVPGLEKLRAMTMFVNLRIVKYR